MKLPVSLSHNRLIDYYEYMCGRYTYYSSEDILKSYGLFESENSQIKLAFDTPNNFNVSPGQVMPVIVRGEQEHRIEFMEWGLIPFWAKSKDKAMKLINAKEETLLEKPTWKKLVQTRRCVIPARGFYEWKTLDGKKLPYYITPKSGMFSFAGLYDTYLNDKGADVMTYVIVTTKPNREMSEVHERMPAFLSKQQMDAWLEPGDMTQSQLDDLLSNHADGVLEIIRVSTDVNNARNNNEKLIYPLSDESDISK